VHRTERTIQRWINEDGMRFVWKGGRKMIRLEDLLLHYRRHLLANPTRQGICRRAAEGVHRTDAPLVVAGE
jgi:hypothetical protein